MDCSVHPAVSYRGGSIPHDPFVGKGYSRLFWDEFPPLKSTILRANCGGSGGVERGPALQREVGGAVEGGGLGAGEGELEGSGGGDHYLGMQPQAILNEHSNNFFLMNNQVRSVRIRHDHNSQTEQTMYRIEFKAASGKTRLTYQGLDVGKAKQLLKQVLGKIVR